MIMLVALLLISNDNPSLIGGVLTVTIEALIWVRAISV